MPPKHYRCASASETKKNILVILVYLCSRPAQGGGAGLEKYYHQNKTAPETKKNILVILVYLCSRPAQGGGAGLVKYYHQNKTAPEPPLHILLHRYSHLNRIKKFDPPHPRGV